MEKWKIILIQVMAFDYGDLADAGDGEGEQDYETTSANGGPSHKIVTDNIGNVILKIGTVVDDEVRRPAKCSRRWRRSG